MPPRALLRQKTPDSSPGWTTSSGPFMKARYAFESSLTLLHDCSPSESRTVSTGMWIPASPHAGNLVGHTLRTSSGRPLLSACGRGRTSPTSSCGPANRRFPPTGFCTDAGRCSMTAPHRAGLLSTSAPASIDPLLTLPPTMRTAAASILTIAANPC